MVTSAILNNHIDIAAGADSGSIAAPIGAANFLISADKNAVASYSRSGSDLTIEFTDGRVLRIDGFFANGSSYNNLVFVDGDGRWLASFDPSRSGGRGVTSVSFEQISDGNGESGFDSSVGLLGILAAAAAGGIGVALSSGGGGSSGFISAPLGNQADVTPPAIPTLVVTDHKAPSVGALASGQTTNDPAPSLSGVGEAGSTVKIYDNGVLIGQTTVGTDGKWTFTPPTPLTDGRHALVVDAVDSAGNKSADSQQTVITVDTAAPAAPTIAGVSDDVSPKIGAVAAGGATNDAHPTISGAGEAGATIAIYDHGTVIGTTTVGPDGAWTFTPTSALSEGAHSVTVTATDAAGSVSEASAAFTFTVDTQAPAEAVTITGATDDVAPQIGLVANGGHTNDTAPVVSGALSAALAPGETVEVLRNGVTIGVATVSGASWSYSDSGLVDGQAYIYTAHVVDAAGNVGAVSTGYTLDIDATAPRQSVTIATIVDDVAPATGNVANGGLTNDSTPELQGSISSALAADEVVVVYRDGARVGEAHVSGTSWSYTDSGLENGASYSYTARIEDAAGNAGASSAAYGVTVQTAGSSATASIAVVTDDQLPETGVVANGGYTNDTTPTLSGTISATLVGTEQVHVFRDGVDIGVATVSGTGWTYTDSGLADGTSHAYRAAIVDGAGNTGTVSSAYTINVDASAPTQAVAITRAFDNVGPVTGAIPAGGTTNDDTPELQGTLSSALAGTEQVHVFRNGVDVGAASVSGSSWSFTDAGLASGSTYAYTAKVVDAAGNAGASSNSLTFTVDTSGVSQTTTILGVTDDIAPSTGSVASGGYTNDTAPTVTGSIGSALGAGEHVTVLRDGVVVGVANVSGTSWTFTDSGLADGGSYTYTALVVNAAGTTGGPSNPYVIHVDASAPTETLTIAGYVDDQATQLGTFGFGVATNDTTPLITGTLSAALAADESVEVYRDGVRIGAASVSGASWTFQDAGLADGHSYLYTARVEDAAGNVATSFASATLVVDQTAPRSPILSSVTDDVAPKTGAVAAGGPTNDVHPVVAGTAEAGTTVTVYDNGVAIGTASVGPDGAWSLTPATALAEGAHGLTATSTDAAGNVSAPTSVFAFVVDTSAPTGAATITAVVDDVAPVTGTVANGGYTNDAAPVVSGELSTPLAAGELVEVLRDGVSIGTANVVGTSWSIADSGLVDGHAYSYTARIVDAAGNSGATSPRYVIHLDTTAPAATEVARILSITTDTGGSSADFVTSDTTLLFNGTVSGALAPGEKVQISLDGGANWRDTTASGSNWSYDNTGSALADGSYTVQARVVDAAGNVGQTTSQSLTIDTTPPSAAETVRIVSITTDTGASPSDFLTNDRMLVFNGALGAPLASGEKVQISLDAGASWHDATTIGSSWSYDNTGVALAEGSYTIQARVIDEAGNVGQGASRTLTIDTTAPSAAETVQIAAITTDTGASSSDFITSDTTLAFSGTVGAGLAAGEKVQISLDNGASWHDATTIGSSWSYDNTGVALAQGSYTIQARVIDEAGNVGNTSSRVLTIDTTPPSFAETVQIASITADTGSSSSDFLTNDRTLIFNGTVGSALAPGERVQVSLDAGASWHDASTVGSSWTYDNTAITFAEGVYTIEARVVDAAGNAGQSASRALTIDTTAPSLAETVQISSISTDTGGSSTDFVTSDSTLAIHGAIGATLAAGDKVQVSLDGGVTWRDATTAGLDWTFDNTGVALADGSYTIQAHVVDAAGNVGQTTSHTLTIDSSAPTFASSTIDLATASDNGTSASDNITSVVTPTIDGLVTGLSAADAAQATAGKISVTLFADANNDGVLDNGERILAQGVGLDVSGTTATFSTDLPSLQNGTYHVKAVLIDAAGNQSATGLLDNNPPALLQINTGAPSVSSDAQSNDGLGYAVASAGDFNGDGYSDFIVSAPHGQYGSSVAGEADVFLLYGTKNGVPSVPAIEANITAAQGVHIVFSGATGVEGLIVTSIGDINGDGFGDVAISSPVDERTYVVFGRSGDTLATLDLASLDNGATTDGFVIKNGSAGASLGNSVSGGDINGDGYSDIIVGSSDGHAAGEYFVLYGHAGAAGSSQWPDLIANDTGLHVATGLLADTPGAVSSQASVVSSTNPLDAHSALGEVVSVIGDINGDGYKDYIVTAPTADSSTTTGVGAAYLILGSASGFGTNFDLASLTSSQGVRITGAEVSEWLGGADSGPATTDGDAQHATFPSVKNIGDINGDGVADFAIGSPDWGDATGDHAASGRVYVIYGSSSHAWSDINLGSLDGTNGFVLTSNSTGTDAQLGFSIANGGDVNGDGVDDFLIGAPGADGSAVNQGAVYLVYGQPGGGFSASTDLDSLVEAGKAIKYNGAYTLDYTGTGVAMGDWNGDGVSDYSYGNWESDSTSPNGGQLYVYTGSIAKLTQAYTTGDDTLSAGGATPGAAPIVHGVDIISGGQGSDVIRGIGADTTGSTSTGIQHDVALGGVGNDTIGIVGVNFTRVDGGLGDDTLLFQGSGLTLDLAAFGERVTGFEQFDLSANGGNTLKLRLSDVLNEPTSSGAATPFVISGDATDTVDFAEAVGAGGWQTTGGTRTINGNTYDVWHNATAGTSTNADILIQHNVVVV